MPPLHAENWWNFEGDNLATNASKVNIPVGALKLDWHRRFGNRQGNTPIGPNSGVAYSNLNLVTRGSRIAVIGADDNVDVSRAKNIIPGYAYLSLVNRFTGSTENCIEIYQDIGNNEFGIQQATDIPRSHTFMVWDPVTGILYTKQGGDQNHAAAYLPEANLSTWTPGSFQPGVAAFAHLPPRIHYSYAASLHYYLPDYQFGHLFSNDGAFIAFDPDSPYAYEGSGNLHAQYTPGYDGFNRFSGRVTVWSSPTDNRVLWQGTEYRSPGYIGKTDDRGHGLAALYGLTTPAQWPAVKAVLTTFFEASPYMEKYLLEALFRIGDTDAALARLKTRYRKMVDSELSTLWEGWGIGPEGYGGGSYNHGWSGGPLTLLGEYVAGIAPTTPGFATYQVKPQLGPLRRVSAGLDTVKGRIAVTIEHTETDFHLRLESPPETVATVALPLAASVTCNGHTVWPPETALTPVPGLSSSGSDSSHLRFTVTPGAWAFTTR